MNTLKEIEFYEVHTFLSIGIELNDGKLIPGLFTQRRIGLGFMPYGLFKYECRNSQTIEKSVVINFTGTLFTCIELPVNDNGVVPDYKKRLELESISYQRWRRIQDENDFRSFWPSERTDSIMTPFVQKKIMQGYKVIYYKNSTIDKLSACPRCREGYFYSFTRMNEDLKECPFCGYKEERMNIRYQSLVKVYYANGDNIVTEINTDYEGAKEYYLGKTFNIGNGESDNIQKCVEIELLETILPKSADNPQ